jgi:small-conductance mechanosensitive channel
MEIAVALISAYGQYEAGQTQQKIYNAKAQQEQQQAAFNAQQAEMQGRSEAIRARNEGLKTLTNINRTISTVRARAGAGAIDPFSGSAGALQTYALREGYTEFDISQENAKLAQSSAGFQANIYKYTGQANANISRVAGEAEARAGMYQAIGTAGGGIASYQKKGGGQAPVTDRSTKIG